MIRNIVASWRPEVSKFYSNVDAQKIAEEIYALGDNPQTEEILDMARDESKEMHKVIEWDDTKAAEKYRLQQVRHVMHDLQVEKIGLNKSSETKFVDVPIRMFHNLVGETGYRPITKIVEDEDLHMKLLRTAWGELQAFMKKYAILSELEPIFEVVNKMIIELDIFDKAG